MENKLKLDYKKTFILGFGFFAISLVWPLYNVYVPLFLRKFLDSQFVINSIMTLDNVLGVLLIPVIGALSDRTQTRFGRRMPFIMIGLPISALMFLVLPFTASHFLWFMLTLTVLNFAMAIYRGPTVALMPDLTPPELRSEANGVINFMGGLASVFVLIGGSALYAMNKSLPFTATTIVMFIALFILIKFIKEPQVGVASDDRISIKAAIKEIFTDDDRKTRLVLYAILFWFIGYQGMEATFSNYAVLYQGTAEHEAGLIIGFFALAFLIFAIPAGFIGKRIGKKRAILIGISGDVAVFTLLNFMGPDKAFAFSKPVMMGLLAIGGLFWACININSYPYVVEGVAESHIGTYTGLYYFASSIAAITGPLLFGLFVDWLGFDTLFLLTAICYFFAWICIRRIPARS